MERGKGEGQRVEEGRGVGRKEDGGGIELGIERGKREGQREEEGRRNSLLLK